MDAGRVTLGGALSRLGERNLIQRRSLDRHRVRLPVVIEDQGDVGRWRRGIDHGVAFRLPEEGGDPFGAGFLHVVGNLRVAGLVLDAVVVDAGRPDGHGVIPLRHKRVDAADEPAAFPVYLEVGHFDDVQFQFGVGALGTVQGALDAEIGAGPLGVDVVGYVGLPAVAEGVDVVRDGLEGGIGGEEAACVNSRNARSHASKSKAITSDSSIVGINDCHGGSLVGRVGIVENPQNCVGAVANGLDTDDRDLADEETLGTVAGIEFVVGLRQKVGAAIATDGGGDGIDEVGAGGGLGGREEAVVEVVEEARDGDECRAVECGAGAAAELDSTCTCCVGWLGRFASVVSG